MRTSIPQCSDAPWGVSGGGITVRIGEWKNRRAAEAGNRPPNSQAGCRALGRLPELSGASQSFATRSRIPQWLREPWDALYLPATPRRVSRSLAELSGASSSVPRRHGIFRRRTELWGASQKLGVLHEALQRNTEPSNASQRFPAALRTLERASEPPGGPPNLLRPRRRFRSALEPSTSRPKAPRHAVGSVAFRKVL